MVSYAYLNDADFSGLERCAHSWKLLEKKYQGIGDQFEQQVLQRLKGKWEGEAAGKAFNRMEKVKKEYEAAGVEAGRMGRLMSDAKGEFSAAQKQLHRLRDDLQTEHFKFHQDGAIEDVDPTWDSPTASGQPGFAEERRRKQEGFVRDRDRILRHATELDQGYAVALKSDRNGEDERGFNKSGYGSDDEARKALKDADDAANLMHKKGPLSPTELDQLNTLLERHKNEPDFAARFAEKSGAENTLDKYGQILNPPRGAHVTPAQRAMMAKLQSNLGTTLGTATRVNSSGMDKFENDLLGAVNQDYKAPNGNLPQGFSGYQLASSLMSKGDWDDNLLDTYGEQMIGREEQLGPRAAWGGMGRTTSGIPALDPMNGFMDALGHNPQASTDFLTGATATPQGKVVDNLDYLLKDRDWPEGSQWTGDADHPKGIATLGHALESGTTGVPYDYNGAEVPPHTAQESGLVNELVTKLGDKENADLMDGDGRLAPIKGSLGHVTANYMGDFQKAFAPSTQDLPTNGVPVAGSDGMDSGHVTNFLATVGQDPQAYKDITAAQTGYTQAAVDQAFDGHGSGSDYARAESDVTSATQPGATVAGIMSEARADAVYDKQVAQADDFNSNIDEANKWVGRGAGVAIGTIASPVAGTATSIGYEELSGMAVEHIKDDQTSEGDFAARDTYAKAANSHQDAVAQMVQRSAEKHGYNADDQGRLGSHAAGEAETTFKAGGAGAAKRG
ncbi:hypothetical protein HCC61_15880 [Streptomyces sp. HNM0575]|uniref:DUF6571 family protein n=1 Tax=Streptomyces sp. HNM0575 TaxID=2716338 RepID=UPI00145FBE26|nr:DUF6571 family protein [Streptomyces sp. HNM0575]NLU74143.1 hypothetical protein [Streptomyces sp. HNM0575]